MARDFKSKPFFFKLYGDYALFTDPATKGGGEKFSYPVPTYQALKGITEQIYWKPTIEIIVDEVKIIQPITSESMGIRPIITTNKGGNDLSYHTYLRNVEYYVKFHFEWNLNRPDLKQDRQEIKHQQIILRSLDRGGRRDIFLGTSECRGFIERLTEKEYQSVQFYNQDSSLDLGIMFHSFIYPSQSGEEKLYSNYHPYQMKNGCIKFVRPEACQLSLEISDYQFKHFDMQNIKSVDEEMIENGMVNEE